MERKLKKKWQIKRDAIYCMRENINNLKRHLNEDMNSEDEKVQLTALIIRIMMLTSERIGNEGSAHNGHFGITQLKPKHVKVTGSEVELNYVGKSGMEHKKKFRNAYCASIIKQLIKRHNIWLFTTAEGFRIPPERVNRYLKYFNLKSKDIRGFNANKIMLVKLKNYGKVKEEKQRPKVFNKMLRETAKKIGHLPSTLRNHYLLPEISEQYYATGTTARIKTY